MRRSGRGCFAFNSAALSAAERASARACTITPGFSDPSARCIGLRSACGIGFTYRINRDGGGAGGAEY
jgi:hypothetical protein